MGACMDVSACSRAPPAPSPARCASILRVGLHILMGCGAAPAQAACVHTCWVLAAHRVHGHAMVPLTPR
eukprot:1479468-Alexandrium_andersonii.AAC.1